MVELLVAHGVISFEQSAVFIDGTKIEANANRHSFVWKIRVTKSQAKLGERIAEELPVLLEKAEAGVVVPKNIKQPIQRKENLKTAMSTHDKTQSGLATKTTENTPNRGW